MKWKNGIPLTLWQIDASAVAVLIALTGLAYLVILQPIAQRQTAISQLRSELGVTKNQAITANTARAAIDARLNRVREEIIVSPVRLEPVEHLNRRIARIVELASQSGMVIHESRSGEVKNGERYRTVPIEISGSGLYSQCASFLHGVYEELPDVDVFGFELNGSPGTPNARSTFRFQFAWYAATTLASADRAP